jgi:hypothetical protein
VGAIGPRFFYQRREPVSTITTWAADANDNSVYYNPPEADFVTRPDAPSTSRPLVPRACPTSEPPATRTRADADDKRTSSRDPARDPGGARSVSPRSERPWLWAPRTGRSRGTSRSTLKLRFRYWERAPTVPQQPRPTSSRPWRPSAGTSGFWQPGTVGQKNRRASHPDRPGSSGAAAPTQTRPRPRAWRTTCRRPGGRCRGSARRSRAAATTPWLAARCRSTMSVRRTR